MQEYWRVKRLRAIQVREKKDLSYLSPQQMGQLPLRDVHHVFETVTPHTSTKCFGVQICKLCSDTGNAVDLGKYFDKESAILINDCYNLMRNRVEKLCCLSSMDVPYLQHISVSTYCDHDCVMEVNVLTLLDNRLLQHCEMAESQAQTSIHTHTHSHIPREPVVPLASDCISFLQRSVVSFSCGLVEHGFTRSNVSVGQATCLLQRIVHRSLSPSDAPTHTYALSSPHSSPTLSNVPTSIIFLLRASMFSYAPIRDPQTLSKVFHPIESEVEDRLAELRLTDGEEISVLVKRFIQNCCTHTARLLLSVLIPYAFDSATLTLHSAHNIKFPRNSNSVQNISDLHVRQSLVRSSCDWDLERFHFLYDIIPILSQAASAAQTSPDTQHLLTQAIQRLLKMCSFMIGSAFTSCTVLCDVSCETDLISSVYQGLHRLPYNEIPSLQWKHFTHELDLCLLICERNNPNPKLDPSTQAHIPRMTECFHRTLDLVKHMPSFDQIRSSTYDFMPVTVDPLEPSVFAMQEAGVWIVTCLCRAMVLFPEIFSWNGADIHNTSSEFIPQLRMLFRTLNLSLTSMYGCLQSTGCGVATIHYFHSMFQIIKTFSPHIHTRTRIHTYIFEAYHMTELVSSIVTLARRTLVHLSAKFILAEDLLGVLETHTHTHTDPNTHTCKQNKFEEDHEDR